MNSDIYTYSTEGKVIADYMSKVTKYICTEGVIIPQAYIKKNDFETVNQILIESFALFQNWVTSDDRRYKIYTDRNLVKVLNFIISVVCQLTIKTESTKSIEWETYDFFPEYFSNLTTVQKKIIQLRIEGEYNFDKLHERKKTDMELYKELDHMKEEILKII